MKCERKEKKRVRERVGDVEEEAEDSLTKTASPLRQGAVTNIYKASFILPTRKKKKVFIDLLLHLSQHRCSHSRVGRFATIEQRPNPPREPSSPSISNIGGEQR